MLQVVMGLTGVVGFLLKYIGPLTIAPTVALIGLALTSFVADMCAENWWLAFGYVLFISLLGCTTRIKYYGMPFRSGMCYFLSVRRINLRHVVHSSHNSCTTYRPG